jgi:hypothetical protein
VPIETFNNDKCLTINVEGTINPLPINIPQQTKKIGLLDKTTIACPLNKL